MIGEVRTITAADTNAARITISVPRLQSTNQDGDVVGASVEIAIDVNNPAIRSRYQCVTVSVHE